VQHRSCIVARGGPDAVVESQSLSDLFKANSKIWQMGPTMTLPIFTAGRISNTVRAREAQQQAVALYLQTIQQAFREVEDALIFHRTAGEIRADRAMPSSMRRLASDSVPRTPSSLACTRQRWSRRPWSTPPPSPGPHSAFAEARE
jgi:outer membrane protein TolC